MTTTAAQLVEPKLQFFGNDGKPLSGGKLYTYQAGTFIPKKTYTSSTMSADNTNPVILDSAGRARVWLDISTSFYQMKLTDSSGVEIWTEDNVSGVGTSGTIIYGSMPWLDSKDYADLYAAVAAISSSKGTILVTNNIPCDNLIVPSNVTIVVLNTGTITVNSGKTLEINGPFEAGPYAVFSGSGTVTFGKDSSLLNLPIWGGGSDIVFRKNAGETQSGLLDWEHDGDENYLMHLHTGPNFTGNSYGGYAVGPPALMGIGLGDGGVEDYGVGIHINNKRSGTCMELVNQPTSLSGGRCLSVQNYADYGPAVDVALTADGSGINIVSSGSASAAKYIMKITSVEGGDATDGYEIFDVMSTTGYTTVKGGMKVMERPLIVTARDSISTDVNKQYFTGNYHRFYEYTGSTGLFYPFRIAMGIDNPTELSIKTGSFAAIGSETYDMTILRAGNVSGGAGIGFLGASPINRPTVNGSRAANAALASLITALANLGLITDSTTA